MRSQDVRIDVTGEADPDGPLVVMVTVHMPDDLETPGIVAVGLPGGGYNRRYYDLRIDGYSNYSQAAYHTARGWVFVACDPIGVGESSRPATPHTIAEVARVQDAVVRQLRKRLAAGSLTPSLAPAPDAYLIGLGQSMGGCFTIAAQGAHASYDAVGILGFSAVHTQMPMPAGGIAQVPPGQAGADLSGDDAAAAMMVSFQWGFHWEDVPEDIAKTDLATVPFRAGDDIPAWASPPLPCGVDMLAPDVVAVEAAAITCPVLVAAGERDVVPAPRAEPAAYKSSGDITVHVSATMAHMHNFASTREGFWQRIHRWGASVAG